VNFLGYDTHFKSELNHSKFGPLGSRSPPYGGVTFGYPFKTRDFCYWRLI